MINWVCNITILILLTTVTGSVLTLTWLFIKHFLKKFVSIRFMHGAICLVLVGYYIPVAFFIMSCQGFSINSMVGVHTPLLDVVMVLLFLVWLCGIVIQGYLLLLEFRRIRRVKKTSYPMPLPQKEKLLASIQEKLPVKRHITVKQGYGVNSPFVSGVFFIKIYYPEVPLNDKEMSNAMLHELVHVIHLDTLWKPLGILLGCIYWFNPLMRIVYEDLDRWREAYCDNTCASLLGSAKEYYEMIFSFSERVELGNRCYLPTWVSGKSELVWRIDCIRQYGRKKMHQVVAMGLVALLVVMSGCTTYAATKETGRIYNTIWYNTMQGERLELPPPLKVREHVVEEETVAQKYTPVTVENIEHTFPYKDYVSLDDVVMEKGTYYTGNAFYRKKGQQIHVSCMSDPDGEKLLVGFLAPDHTITYITGKAIQDHAFQVEKDGMYRIFLANKSRKKQEATILFTHRLEEEENE